MQLNSLADTLYLRALVEKSGLEYILLAEKLGITLYGLQKKIANNTEFKASEIKKLTGLLSLGPKERAAIFLPVL